MSSLSAAGDLAIRPFARQDIAQVAAIEKLIAPDPWSRDLFAGEFDMPETARLWLVAESVPTASTTLSDDPAPTIVGFGGLMFATDEAHIMNMGVLPSAQRRGVASRLLATLLLEAVDRGSVAATLEARTSNAAAIALYERFGFVSAGVRPSYYQDGEDATIMWVHRIYDDQYTQMLRAVGD